MKITREEPSQRQVLLSVELDPIELEPYLDRSYRRVVNRLQIPGFRKGKAPRPIVENHVGREALVQESLDYILQQTLQDAIEQEELETFGEPDVELVEMSPLSFKAVVPLEPIVDLGDFRGLRLEPEVIEVTDEQVDQVIEQARYEAAPWVPVERGVQFGDLLTIDVDGFISGEQVADDKGVEFIPRQENALPFPGFSIYLEGMKKDETREFTLAVPEDFQDGSIAGKECRFVAKVLEIKEKALPEIDDVFAKGVGDGYESPEALKESILADLKTRAEQASERALQERTLEEVIKGTSIEVAQITADREIDHLMEDQARAQAGQRVDMDTYLRNAGKTREELREELLPLAQERLTRFLVLRKLATEEGIELYDEEIDDEVDKLVGGSAQGSAESIEAMRRAFSSDSARSSLGNAIVSRKVMERLSQIARGVAGDDAAPDPDDGDEPVSDAPHDPELEAPVTQETGLEQDPQPGEAPTGEQEGSDSNDQ